MSGIVCAIRGGPASQPTIAQAVTLAQKTGLPLHFLYVVNLDFLSRVGSGRVHTISEEMHQMGEFILLTAQATATAQGVTAQGAVRHGNVGDEIIGLCRELDAAYVILGQPQVQGKANIFTKNLLKKFSERIERETGAKVFFAEGSGM